MKKVLVVEDNSLNMELFVDILSSMGFTVRSAVDGEKAVEMAEEETYDLILMDIELPNIDGIEAARLIRNKPKYENTPILAVTAFAMKGDRDDFLAKGFNDYIAKPIDVTKFMMLLEDYK